MLLACMSQKQQQAGSTGTGLPSCLCLWACRRRLWKSFLAACAVMPMDAGRSSSLAVTAARPMDACGEASWQCVLKCPWTQAGQPL